MRTGVSHSHRRVPVVPIFALALIAGPAAGCDLEDVRFGRKPAEKSPTPDGGLGADQYELDLGLLGDRRHRVVAAVKGRDVRQDLPPRSVRLEPGQRVFAVVPVGRDWKRVGWRAARVESVDPRDRFTVRLEEGRLFDGVPSAMLIESSSKPLAAGAVVRVHVGRGLPFGLLRARGAQGGAKRGTRRVTVATTWLGAAREVQARRREVLAVRSGLRPAGPVVYEIGESHRLGSLVATSRKHRWVLGAEGVVHLLPWTRVKPIRFGRRYQPGDQVRAALPVSLRLVSVIRALDGGVRYEVGWAQTKRQEVSFARLAPP